MDYDDVVEMNDLVDLIGVDSKTHETCVGNRDNAKYELSILMADSLDKIPETLSWDNKIIKLMSINPLAKDIFREFCDNRTKVRQLEIRLKALTERINVKKKVYEQTPR